MRTKEEKTTAIAELRKQQATLPPNTAFGDSNTDAYNAAVEVIEKGLDNDDIFDNWENDQYILDMALQALQWMDGEIEMDELIGE